MRLKDRIAIVTGGGSGFGEGIATAFAGAGARVVVADIDEAAGRRVAEAITGGGGRAVSVAIDVGDGAAVARMVATAAKAFGGLDILVNNAGYSHRNKPLLEVDEAEFDRIFTVNVKAIFHAVRHAVPLIERRGDGSILNTASTAALRPRPGLTW